MVGSSDQKLGRPALTSRGCLLLFVQLMALRLCTRTSTLPCARKGLAIIDCSAIRHFSLTHRLHEATHWGKYSDKLQKVAEE